MNCPTCQTELEQHPASRCLDGWIAEFILGYQREKSPPDADGNFGGEDFLVPPGGIPKGFVLPPKGRIGLPYFAPEVSSRWEHTWRLFTRFEMQIACFGRGFYAGLSGDPDLFRPDNPRAAFDIKPSLAICKAALKIQALRLGEANQ